jgi:predicted nucleic acid-binding protein
MEIKTLVDAGPLIGWLNADDQWHEWSVSILSAQRGSLHTTEIVLGEAVRRTMGLPSGGSM